MTDQQRNSIKALAVFLDTACDQEGSPLKPGVAERIAHRLSEAVPELLAVMAEMAKGRKVS